MHQYDVSSFRLRKKGVQLNWTPFYAGLSQQGIPLAGTLASPPPTPLVLQVR